MESNQKMQTNKTVLPRTRQEQVQASQTLLATRTTAVYTSNNGTEQPQFPKQLNNT